MKRPFNPMYIPKFLDFRQLHRDLKVKHFTKRDTPNLLGELSLLDKVVYDIILSYAYFPNFDYTTFNSIIRGAVIQYLLDNSMINKYTSEQIDTSISNTLPRFKDFPPKYDEDIQNENN